MKKIIFFLTLQLLFVVSQLELWNQMDIGTASGFISTAFANKSNLNTGVFPGIAQAADDFVVPTGQSWSISEIQMLGFFQPLDPPTGNLLPLTWIIDFYDSITTSAGILPNNNLLSRQLTPTTGNLGDHSPIFNINPPLIVNPGRYWISVCPLLTGNGTLPRFYAYNRNTTGGTFMNSLKMSFKDVTGMFAPFGTFLFGNWLNYTSIGTAANVEEMLFSILGNSFPVSSTIATSTATFPSSSSGANLASSSGANLASSSSSNGVASSTSCTFGTLGCACSQGVLCNTGLSCYSGTCIAAITPGAPINSATGGNANLIPIIAGSVGGFVFLAIVVGVVVVIVLFSRRRNAHQSNPAPVELGSLKPGYDTIPVTPGGSAQRIPILSTSTPSSLNGTSRTTIPTSYPSYSARGSTNVASYEIEYSELEFEKEVGRGSFGVVFRGRWRGGIVAIKQVLLQGALTPKEMSEFKSEAAVMKNLRPHVNVVQFLGITSSPQLCIITEFLDNGSLYQLVFSDAKVDANLLSNIAKGIAAGMMHLHKEGIVHRDLATRNILLGAGYQVKISDFGLSRVVESGNTSNSNHTRSETGPLKWMSPEAIRNREYSVKSDVWAFGVTLYEIIARNEPYLGLDPVQTALQVTGGLRLDIPYYTPAVLAEVMTGCFKTDPNLRPDFATISKRFSTARVDEWLIRT